MANTRIRGRYSPKTPSKRRIMIVEDEPVVASDIGNRLKGLGYDFISDIVRSGEGAIVKAEAARPDLVLMDIRLEGEMDGIQAAEHIRARFNIPVVYLTAYSDEATLQRAKTTEPYGYLLKPFEDRELHVAIEIALYKHQMERKLKASEQRLSTTLKSIGDAVIATDKEGLVTFMNPIAEALTGWKQEDALGKDLTEVFHIIHEETRTLTESPITKALQEGVVVGRGSRGDFPTLLIAKDGIERPIDESVAPIKDDKGKIIGTVLAFRDITERVRAEEQIKAALAEKEVLMLEVHHRVKNNLQVLVYLIDMQAETIENPKVLQALVDIQGRIRAMYLIHEKLYQAEDLAQINFGEYLEDLTSNLLHVFGGGQSISLRVDAEDIFINVNVAIPCGMIVNELVTNALKYAFPTDDVEVLGRDGDRPLHPRPEIRVEFRSREDEYVLMVGDNGVGMPPELDWRTTESLGLKLVNIWATHQLGGSIEVDIQHGTAFKIRFTERKWGSLSND